MILREANDIIRICIENESIAGADIKLRKKAPSGLLGYYRNPYDLFKP